MIFVTAEIVRQALDRVDSRVLDRSLCDLAQGGKGNA